MNLASTVIANPACRRDVYLFRCRAISLKERPMKSRIMYIESKAEGLEGPASIGRVTFSKTGKTIYYRGRSFQSLKGYGFKANYFDVESGAYYWISGPRKDGQDRLYGAAWGFRLMRTRETSTGGRYVESHIAISKSDCYMITTRTEAAPDSHSFS
jgi:hypothetical protein